MGEPNAVRVFLVLRGKATADGVSSLLSIVREVLTEAAFHDRGRVVEVLKERVAGFRHASPRLLVCMCMCVCVCVCVCVFSVDLSYIHTLVS